ncbi:hypothetical protein Tsubulata_050044 [Turnera subulata]|uniref:Bifunctional inhibitor/plant lipid transfer protein/seed storage helical domain-containing protein n=1 Tax=Turnera subulata TaxID=218843 RepID=A0A9Q0FVZ2_9ROSI|nr:hypothetical protein Tsubulata_050044 [Turnera subulata]
MCWVVNERFPTCLDFLIGRMDEPSEMCCNNVDKLNWIAKHGLARQICWCIEYIVRDTEPEMIPSRIDDLLIKCGTRLSFPISDSKDCDKVGSEP